jgi:formylglycine-generating enzyme required for sulfatase activity
MERFLVALVWKRGTFIGLLGLQVILLLFLTWGEVCGEDGGHRRLAFVVGVREYENSSAWIDLPNAVNDAVGMSEALQKLGFVVKQSLNPSRSAFYSQWQEFLKTVNPGDIVAIAFAGHGIEIAGSTLLIPKDAPEPVLGGEIVLREQSISFQSLLIELSQRRPDFSLVILNACRQNPFANGTMGSVSDGLSIIKDTPTGTFVMYSAGAHQRALERLNKKDTAPYSVYTRKLLPLMLTPGLNLLELASEVGIQVRDLARTVTHEQWPAFYAGAVDARKICLAGCQPGNASGKADVASAIPPPPPAPPKLKEPAAVITPTPCYGGEILIAVGDHYKGPIQLPLRRKSELSCFKPGAGKTEYFKDCPTCPEMVVVPSGTFTMGAPASEPDRSNFEDQVRVSIAAPFAVGRFALTFDEWDACVADGGCNGYKPDDRGWGRGKHPVINVDWDDAKAYASWLSRKTGKTYRLLSEAEREYVTRAGTTTPFWWGTSINPGQANYDGNYTYGGGSKGEFRQRTVPVDSFEPNPWGLYQVHGNVWDWTEDCLNETNNGNPGDGSARTSGDCSGRMIRGGAYMLDPPRLRSAGRGGDHAGSRLSGLGFRLARTLAP